MFSHDPNVWNYLDRTKNPIWCFFQILIGNYTIIRHLKEWIKEDDFAGFTANTICSPIYFKRKSRCIEAISNSDDTKIDNIISYGYEDEFINISGQCIKEKTTITFKNSEKITMINKDEYEYTYIHIIKSAINVYEGK